MTIRRHLLLASVVLPVLSAPALAADLDPIAPPVVVETATSGWYLRGDLGYTFDTDTDGYYYGWDAAAYPDLRSYGYDSLDYQWNFDVSAGVGYQFNDYFRADATVGYWSRDVSGSATSPAPCIAGVPGAASCRFDDTSTLSAWEFMANGYVDVGHWYGFTPYLGAGLGVARLDYGELTNDATCVDWDGDDIAGCGYTGHHEGRSSTRFVWALMAGTSYDLTDRLKFDLGYRFARYEGGDAWGWDQWDSAAGAEGTQSFDNGFSMHQIRAGLRVALW